MTDQERKQRAQEFLLDLLSRYDDFGTALKVLEANSKDMPQELQSSIMDILNYPASTGNLVQKLASIDKTKAMNLASAISKIKGNLNQDPSNIKDYVKLTSPYVTAGSTAGEHPEVSAMLNKALAEPAATEEAKTDASKTGDLGSLFGSQMIQKDIERLSKGDVGGLEFLKKQVGTGAGYLAEQGLPMLGKAVGGKLGDLLGSSSVASIGGALGKFGTEKLIEGAVPGSATQGSAEERYARDDFQKNVLPKMLEQYPSGSSAYFTAQQSLMKDFENKMLAKRSEIGREERKMSLSELINQQEEASRQRQYGLAESELGLKAQSQKWQQDYYNDIQKMSIPPEAKSALWNAFLTRMAASTAEAGGAALINTVLPGMGSAGMGLLKSGYKQLTKGGTQPSTPSYINMGSGLTSLPQSVNYQYPRF